MKAVWRWALPLLALVQHTTQLSCAALMFCTFLILVLETSITLCSVVSEWVYPQFFFYLSQPHSTSHFDTGTLWHWHTTMKGSAVRRCSYCDQCKSGRSIWLAWSRGHRDYMPQKWTNARDEEDSFNSTEQIVLLPSAGWLVKMISTLSVSLKKQYKYLFAGNNNLNRKLIFILWK